MAGWIEIRLSWRPAAQTEPEASKPSMGAAEKKRTMLAADQIAADLWGGGGEPVETGGRASEERSLANLPVAGTLVVEVLRAEGLSLCEFDGTAMAAVADPKLFVMAVVAMLGYICIGLAFYLVFEEHYDAPPLALQLSLNLTTGGRGGGTVDTDGDGVVSQAELDDAFAGPMTCRPWTVLDSLYFTVIAFTTAGLGDYGPSSPGSKVFTALFSLTGVTPCDNDPQIPTGVIS